MSNLISISTKKLCKNLAAADLHPEVNTRSNIRTSKVETLAKLYLDSEPAQITDATLIELCDWLWGEFQATPLNLEFSWFDRYQNATEMFTDIKQSHLWISDENYDTSLGLNPIYNFILYALHNYDHYRTHSDFSMAGELATYNATAKRAPSLDIQKIIYSESVLRPAAYLLLGHAPTSKIVFP